MPSHPETKTSVVRADDFAVTVHEMPPVHGNHHHQPYARAVTLSRRDQKAA